MKTSILRAAGYLAGVLLALCPLAKASAIVTFSTINLGGGEYQYDFTVNNTSGTTPISGLLIVGASSVFGLDLGSTIGVPAGWGSITPFPPFTDFASIFSSAPPADVAIGASLDVATFDSDTNPASVPNVDVVLIASDSSQTPYRITPEPETIYLVVTGFIGVAIKVGAPHRWFQKGSFVGQTDPRHR